MNNGVERKHPGQGSIGERQRQYVSLLELDVRVPSAGFAQQVRREIQAVHPDAAAVEERGRLPGATPQIISRPAPADLGGKSAQQLPVQGLVREFAGEAVRVLPCDRVVTSPDVVGG